MIDARRWILVEAWLALGLRVEWASRYFSPARPEAAWQDDEEERHRFIYSGNKTWLVRDERQGIFVAGSNVAPTMGTETLRHELAHYLTATSDQRDLVNFGAGEAEETRALEAEQVIDAMLAASARIAELALRGRP